MRKEDAALLVELTTAMQEEIAKMEEFYNNKDMEKLNGVKKEILAMQKQIDDLIK